MGKSKDQKLKDKRAKADAKKSKISKKFGKAFAVLALLAMFGCSTSEPASRVTRGEYGDVRIYLERGCTNNHFEIKLGDAAYASADSKGSTETTTANPTQTISPTTDLNLTKGAAAAADATAAAINAGANLLGKGIDACKGGSCSDGSCASGECSPGGCSDGSCSDCSK